MDECKNSKRALASINEERVAENFTILKKLVEEVLYPIPFKFVIGEIGGVSGPSYYNYISKGSKQRGRVSLFVVNEISEYFDISDEPLKGERYFTDEEKEKIKDVLKKRFINKQDTNEKKGNENLLAELEERKKYDMKIIKEESDLEVVERLVEYYTNMAEYGKKIAEILKMEDE